MIISGTTVSGNVNLGTFGLPGAPIIDSVSTTETTATIYFTPPEYTGGTPITEYTVVSNTGITVTGTSSPITITGLNDSSFYDFDIFASNIQGKSSNNTSSFATLVRERLAPIIDAVTSTLPNTIEVNYVHTDTENLVSYTATSSPGGITATSNVSGSGTIAVTGLSSNTTYTFTISANYSNGITKTSQSSDEMTTSGEALYTGYVTPYYTWVCPPGVTSVSVLCIGAGGPGGGYGGGGGGGGALSYGNNLTVVPGTSYNLRPGFSGPSSAPQSWFSSTSYLYANNGSSGTYGSDRTDTAGGGGGGAGGYAGAGGLGGDSGVTGAAGGNGGTGGGTARTGGGNGGKGGRSGGNWVTVGSSSADNGVGGGGGGGSGGADSKGGGGVGIYGQGTNGVGGTATSAGTMTGAVRTTQGGSGGSYATTDDGASYGGGGGKDRVGSYGYGGPGCVRIIWPGNARTFPSTRTAYE